MRKDTTHLEIYRVRKGTWASTAENGMNGAFIIPDQFKRARLIVLVSDQMGWEHVSVHVRTEKRVPTWADMCYIKDLFWAPDEWAIQYHPAEGDAINFHPYTLHLWRPVGLVFPTPPKIFV